MIIDFYYIFDIIMTLKISPTKISKMQIFLSFGKALGKKMHMNLNFKLMLTKLWKSNFFRRRSTFWQEKSPNWIWDIRNWGAFLRGHLQNRWPTSCQMERFRALNSASYILVSLRISSIICIRLTFLRTFCMHLSSWVIGAITESMGLLFPPHWQSSFDASLQKSNYKHNNNNKL